MIYDDAWCLVPRSSPGYESVFVQPSGGLCDLGGLVFPHDDSLCGRPLCRPPRHWNSRHGFKSVSVQLFHHISDDLFSWNVPSAWSNDLTCHITMSLTLSLVIVDRKGGVGRVQAQLLVMHTLFPHTGPGLDWWWWGWWPGLDAELLKEISETWCRAPGCCRGPWNFCWLEILFYYRWHQVNLVAHIACWLP